MYRRLPAMAALRAFEAAAQLLSFKQAARQLHRTPSAISHQIRGLEAELGAALFRRDTDGLRLTEAGVQYLEQVTSALSMLDEATTRLQRQHGNGPISISLFPSLAVRWLIPRLNDFRVQYPDVEIALVNSLRQADFEHDDIDAAIRFGDGTWRGLRADPLMEETLFPVCSPHIAAGPPTLREPADLAHAVLLRNGAHPDEWDVWFQALGMDVPKAERGLVFDASNEVLAAAANGMGVAMGRHPLVEADLASGRLVAPFSQRVRTPGRYWFVVPEDAADRSDLIAFRNWLLNQLEPA